MVISRACITASNWKAFICTLLPALQQTLLKSTHVAHKGLQISLTHRSRDFSRSGSPVTGLWAAGGQPR